MADNLMKNDRATVRIRRVAIPLYGLGCGGGGVLTVERAVCRMAGVRNAYANPATEMVYIEYDPNLCGPEQLAAAINSTGLSAGAPIIR